MCILSPAVTQFVDLITDHCGGAAVSSAPLKLHAYFGATEQDRLYFRAFGAVLKIIHPSSQLTGSACEI